MPIARFLIAALPRLDSPGPSRHRESSRHAHRRRRAPSATPGDSREHADRHHRRTGLTMPSRAADPSWRVRPSGIAHLARRSTAIFAETCPPRPDRVRITAATPSGISGSEAVDVLPVVAQTQVVTLSARLLTGLADRRTSAAASPPRTCGPASLASSTVITGRAAASRSNVPAVMAPVPPLPANTTERCEQAIRFTRC